MRKSFLSIVLFAMSCAHTTSTAPQASVVSDPKNAPHDATVVICEQEHPTGSLIAETKCRRVEDKEADRRNAQQFLEEAPTHSVPPWNGK